MSARTCGFDSRPRHQIEIGLVLADSGNLKSIVRALVAQWIERSPAKAEVVGSNPAKRAIVLGAWGISIPFVARSVVCWVDALVVDVTRDPMLLEPADAANANAWCHGKCAD